MPPWAYAVALNQRHAHSHQIISVHGHELYKSSVSTETMLIYIYTSLNYTKSIRNGYDEKEKKSQPIRPNVRCMCIYEFYAEIICHWNQLRVMWVRMHGLRYVLTTIKCSKICCNPCRIVIRLLLIFNAVNIEMYELCTACLHTHYVFNRCIGWNICVFFFYIYFMSFHLSWWASEGERKRQSFRY